MVTAKWPRFFLFAALGIVLIAGGLLVPAHLRAVDSRIIRRAGWEGQGLLQRGRAQANEKHLGVALMLAQAAREGNISGWDRLGETVTNLARQFPRALFWGSDTNLEKIFLRPVGDYSGPLIAFLIRHDNRQAVLAHLGNASLPAVQELLRCRDLKNTTLFPPSASASGQAFDATIAEGGLLLAAGNLTTSLGDEISALAATANRGGNSEPLEQTLMNLLSLGQRLNWDQFVEFVGEIPNAETLHKLADEARSAGEKFPVLFAGVELSGQPSAVANYLNKFPQSGLADLTASLDSGAGGVGQLIRSDRRVYDSPGARRTVEFKPLRQFQNLATSFSFQQPHLALAVKWLAYLLGGFLLATAVHSVRPAVTPLEAPLEVRGLHLLRESLFSFGFLLAVLLVSEPFLAQQNAPQNFSLRPHLPMLGSAAPANLANLKSNLMNQNSTILLTLLLFFVLQGLIYLACLLKLAEIRRQAMLPRMKLKLLENEEHLFDAGLYLGFAGTVVSLIIASLHFIQFSLMAAYSSTCFGIIFVVVFKIFNLRPARRKLLLEAELLDASAPAAKQTVST